jgi:hypothetical protein
MNSQTKLADRSTPCLQNSNNSMNSFHFPWTKQGQIFTSAGQHSWMQTHNQNPCALVLEDRIRVYFTCRPGPDDRGYFNSVISFVEIDRNDPQKVLHVHDRPLLEAGGMGAFDQFGTMPGAVLRVGDEVWMSYVGWMRCEGAGSRTRLALLLAAMGE